MAAVCRRIVPCTFILIDDDVLAEVSSLIDWSSPGTYNSELRLATICNYIGHLPVPNPLAGNRITWQAHPPETIISPGMWHPIKWIAQPGH